MPWYMDQTYWNIIHESLLHFKPFSRERRENSGPIFVQYHQFVLGNSSRSSQIPL